MAEEHELIKKHTNEAIQALVPLLDNEKTRHIGHVLLKAIDLGLGLLEGDTNGANNQIKVSGASPPGTVPQNFQKDVEQENRVQGLVDETLKELEMMDNHESNPITTDKDGNEINKNLIEYKDYIPGKNSEEKLYYLKKRMKEVYPHLDLSASSGSRRWLSSRFHAEVSCSPPVFSDP